MSVKGERFDWQRLSVKGERFDWERLSVRVRRHGLTSEVRVLSLFGCRYPGTHWCEDCGSPPCTADGWLHRNTMRDSEGMTLINTVVLGNMCMRYIESFGTETQVVCTHDVKNNITGCGAEKTNVPEHALHLG